MVDTLFYSKSFSSLSQEFIFSEEEPSLSFIAWINIAADFSDALLSYHILKRVLSAVLNPSCTPLFTAYAFGLADPLATLALSDDVDWN